MKTYIINGEEVTVKRNFVQTGKELIDLLLELYSKEKDEPEEEE